MCNLVEVQKRLRDLIGVCDAKVVDVPECGYVDIIHIRDELLNIVEHLGKNPEKSKRPFMP